METFYIFYSLILLNVEEAKTNFHKKNANKSQKDSLVCKFLEKDPEIATVMAVDLIIGGIDTVHEFYSMIVEFLIHKY